jgi:hypothetical protein
VILPLFLGAMILVIISKYLRVLRVSISRNFGTSENRNDAEEFYYIQHMYKLIHRYNEGLEYHMLGIIT